MSGAAPPGLASPLAAAWTLDPAVTFLNHGSFGACPRAVLDAQSAWRARLEREPVRFMVRELEGLLDDARAQVAAFVGADADDLAFVPNATTAVNAVLGSLSLLPGDELVETDHGYNACHNVLVRAAERAGARLVTARVPWPCPGDDAVVDAVRAVLTPRTRLVLVDHVTSPTGLVFPIERLARELAARGIDVLVDGAHAPGMLPLDLRALAAAGATYYTGNFHKWCCAPKGAAMLWVRRDRQASIRPTVISHGANAERADRSRFRLEFDWTGSQDPSAYLAVPEALRFMATLVPGGWPEVMQRNRALALSARRTLAAALGAELPAPDAMLGSLAAVPLPPGPAAPLQRRLEDEHAIQVPIIPIPWGTIAGGRLVRVSAQLYNHPAQYERLAAALVRSLDPPFA